VGAPLGRLGEQRLGELAAVRDGVDPRAVVKIEHAAHAEVGGELFAALLALCPGLSAQLELALVVALAGLGEDLLYLLLCFGKRLRVETLGEAVAELLDIAPAVFAATSLRFNRVSSSRRHASASSSGFR
jgi:hypothetical protein